MTRIIYACAECGSTNVLKDAYACWDVSTQDWVLSSTYDSNTCDDCGEHDISLVEIEADENGDPIMDNEDNEDEEDA